MARVCLPRGSNRTIVCSVLLLGVVSAQGSGSTGSWEPVAVTSAPPPRTGYSLTEWRDGELLLFGGDAANPSATEWSWTGVEWLPVTTPVPRRAQHAMGRNDDTGDLVVFGGISAAGAGITDTWVFQNGTWSQAAPVQSPPILLTMTTAFDPVSRRVTLLGKPVGPLQLWQWEGSTWAQVPIVMPPAAQAVLVADPVRHELLMITNELTGNVVYRRNDLVWEQIGALPLPPFARLAVTDRARGRVVATTASLVTHEWDGLAATAAPVPTGAPVSPAFFAVQHSERLGETFGVFNTGSMQVWRYEALPRPLAQRFGVACQSGAFRFDVAAGDSPEPGGVHRLEATGSPTNALTFSVLGFSHVASGAVPLPVPIPLGALHCLLRVEAAIVTLLGAGLPQSQLIPLPASSALLGARYDGQAMLFDATGVVDTSNGLHVKVGSPLPERVIVESFASAQNRDALASGDTWGAGVLVPARLGGDGRHGSFDPSIGTQVLPNVYEVDGSNTLIPASRTLSGFAELVTDGRFFFTDFVVPAGVTVRFVGPVPAVVTVRGQASIDGSIELNGSDLPFWVPTSGPAAGQRVSTFNARGSTVSPAPFITGQPGTRGGAGGGRGGNGANECQGAGPIVVGGVPLTDGQPGQPVQVLAGHAYAASAPPTAGLGSPLQPPTGISSNLVVVSSIYRAQVSPGGSGGGYGGAGSAASYTVPVITPPWPTAGIAPLTAGGSAFPLQPVPAGAPSLEHFLVGGSGGGGGGSHQLGTFALTTNVDQFLAGHGGTGGGGALALRAGGSVQVLGDGRLQARGGDGVFINGSDTSGTANLNFGISSPGGGGSGGSILVQSAADVAFAGEVDVRGGTGSRTDFVTTPATLNIRLRGGDGGNGHYRFEAGGAVVFTGAGTPAFSAAANVGALVDQDPRSGSRSGFYLLPTTVEPTFLRYEVRVDTDGDGIVDAVLSDDPAVGPPADHPAAPVLVRFQGARPDALTGAPVPATFGPWRAQIAPGADSVGRDRARMVRFDLVANRGSFPNLRVREVRVLWR
jgi:hypothetical protein